MDIAYITTEKAKVSKFGDALLVRFNGRILTTIPLIEMKSLVIVGSVQLTTQVIHSLMSKGISVYYMNHSGQFWTISNHLNHFEK